jgi:hypothetical protein
MTRRLRRFLQRLRLPWPVFALLGCSPNGEPPCEPAGTFSTGLQCVTVCVSDGFALGTCADNRECALVQSTHYVEVVSVGGAGKPSFQVLSCEEWWL